MGINKLWQVIRPSSRTVKLESLKYRRLAIDASIWLTSFVKAMRDSNGNTIHNAHLKGLWGRLCKMLFFGMKPVFVFDGTPPLLKAETLLARRRARAKATGELTKIAERILLNQLKLSTIAQAKQLVKEGKVNLDDAVKFGVSLPSALSVGQESMDPVDLTEHTDQDPEEPAHVDLIEAELDKSIAEDNEAVAFARQFTDDELRQMGVSDSFVQDLPREMQLALLTQMKSAHLGRVGALSMASTKRITGDNYSNLQVEQLVHRGIISRRLETVRHELDQEIFKPIASDPKVRYRVTSTSVTPIKSLLHDNDASDSTVRTIFQNDIPASSSTAQKHQTDQLSMATRTNGDHSSTTSHSNTPSQRPNTNEHVVTTQRRSSPYRSSTSSHETTYTTLARPLNLPTSDPDLELVDLVSDDENNDFADVDETYSLSDDGIMEEVVDTYQNVQEKHDMEAIEVHEDEDEFGDVEFEDVDESQAPSTMVSSREHVHIEDSFEELPHEPIEPPQSGSIFGADVVEESALEMPPPSTIQPPTSTLLVSSIASTSPAASQGSSVVIQDDDMLAPFPAPVPTMMAHSTNEDEIQLLYPPGPSQRPIISSESSKPKNQSTETSVGPHASSTWSKDLDISTDEQLMPSLNHSTISEEEFQRHQQLTTFENLEAELQREVVMLQGAAREEQNHAATLTSEAVDEAKELLKLFGIPFVQSPSEADAQCAVLQMLGLVDGIVSDDSDILVFGGDTIFRYLFSSKHDLQLYHMEDVQSELGLDHDSLIFLALLLGGDYADGIPNVGPKVALEIVNEFPGPEGMKRFVSWLTAYREGHQDYDFPGVIEPSGGFIKKHAKLLKTMKLPSSFPNASVLDAYQNPRVDDSKEAFSWGWPNLNALRQFALEKFGWTKDRTDANLLPVIQKYTAALSDTQTKIETFFTQASIHGRKAPPPARKPKKSASVSAVASSSTSTSSSTTPSATTTAESTKKKRTRQKKSYASFLEEIGIESSSEGSDGDQERQAPPKKRSKNQEK